MNTNQIDIQQFQPNYQEMKMKLTKLFSVSRNNNITQQQIYSILTKNNEFSKEIFQEIVSQIIIHPEDPISISNFIDVYLQADQTLCERAFEAINNISQLQNKKAEVNFNQYLFIYQLFQELYLAKQNEQQNEFGIDFDSQLYCIIGNAVQLPPGRYQIQIKSKSLTVETTITEVTQNPIWNQHVQIPIENPKEIIEFLLNKYETNFYYEKKRVLPVVQLFLFINQEIKSHKMIGALGDPKCRIYLELQWIHTKVLLLEDFLREVQYYEPHLKQEEDNLFQIKNQLKQLRIPLNGKIIEQKIPSNNNTIIQIMGIILIICGCGSCFFMQSFVSLYFGIVVTIQIIFEKKIETKYKQAFIYIIVLQLFWMFFGNLLFQKYLRDYFSNYEVQEFEISVIIIPQLIENQSKINLLLQFVVFICEVRTKQININQSTIFILVYLND